MKKSRVTLILSLALSMAIVMVSSARATVTIASDGIPESDGFAYLSGTLSGVTVSALTGRFTVSSCPIGSSNSNCTETGFSMRSIPVEFNSNFNDLCTATDAFTNSVNLAAVCSVNNGSVSNALAGTVVSASVTAEGCDSWTISWTKANSRLYWVDKQTRPGYIANASFLLWGSITLSLRQTQLVGGDRWTISYSLTGEGRASGAIPGGGSQTFTASPWTMSGSVTTGAVCTGPEQSSVITITGSSGGATVSN